MPLLPATISAMLGVAPAHSGDGGGDQLHAEEVAHQLGQSILGQ
jgi:hypothetical protein